MVGLPVLAVARSQSITRRTEPQGGALAGDSVDFLEKGHLAEALESFQRGDKLLAARPPRGAARPSAQRVAWCRKLIALDAKWATILKDGPKVVDPADGLALAELYRLKGSYLQAALIYGDVLKPEPEWTRDPENRFRYHAACAAALADQAAATGTAKDLPATAPALLRQLAVTWLRADLAAWAKKLEDGSGDPAEVLRQLAHWQNDPCLSGVRAPAELNKLPAAERATCERLWKDVDALRAKANRRK